MLARNPNHVPARLGFFLWPTVLFVGLGGFFFIMPNLFSPVPTEIDCFLHENLYHQCTYPVPTIANKGFKFCASWCLPHFDKYSLLALRPCSCIFSLYASMLIADWSPLLFTVPLLFCDLAFLLSLNFSLPLSQTHTFLFFAHFLLCFWIISWKIRATCQLWYHQLQTLEIGPYYNKIL